MNAKQELIEFCDGLTIQCAEIRLGLEYGKDFIHINLKIGGNLEEFLQALNFEYDNGYGGQNLFGIVWFTDGTWAERGEYDGSEWWEHRKCPEIPEELG